MWDGQIDGVGGGVLLRVYWRRTLVWGLVARSWALVVGGGPAAAQRVQSIAITSAEWSGAPPEQFGPLLDAPLHETVGKRLTGKQIAT